MNMRTSHPCLKEKMPVRKIPLFRRTVSLRPKLKGARFFTQEGLTATAPPSRFRSEGPDADPTFLQSPSHNDMFIL